MRDHMPPSKNNSPHELRLQFNQTNRFMSLMPQWLIFKAAISFLHFTQSLFIGLQDEANGTYAQLGPMHNIYIHVPCFCHKHSPIEWLQFLIHSFWCMDIKHRSFPWELALRINLAAFGSKKMFTVLLVGFLWSGNDSYTKRTKYLLLPFPREKSEICCCRNDLRLQKEESILQEHSYEFMFFPCNKSEDSPWNKLLEITCRWNGSIKRTDSSESFEDQFGRTMWSYFTSRSACSKYCKIRK